MASAERDAADPFSMGHPDAGADRDSPVDSTRHAAIEWLAIMTSGEVSAAERAGHAAWLAADTRHVQAWAGVQEALQRVLAPVRSADRAAGAGRGANHGADHDEVHGALRSALERPRSGRSRRRALRGLAGLAVGATASGLWLSSQGRPAWLADQHTGTGERRRLELDDGSELILNAGSAVDVEFSAGLRRLRLRQGTLLVSVAPDAGRPFVVATPDGEVRALGTRYMVGRHEGRSQVTVLQHRVRVEVPGVGSLTVDEGRSAWFDRSSLSPPGTAAPGTAAWVNGMVSVNDEPLSVVIDALRPYHRASIHLSPDAAGLRVLGAFPLDAADTALESLEQILPIRVRRYGPWLVTIRRRGG